MKGVDVRKAGSGNIGATNVGRLLGRRFGALVFVLDVLKGLVPTLVAGQVLSSVAADTGAPDPARYASWLAIGVACVLGHNHSVFLGFSGGKGVSTSFGVALGIYPELTIPALAALGVWVLVVATSRYVAVASMSAAVALPIAFVTIEKLRGGRTLGDSWPLLVFSALMAVLVLMRHRSNVAHLMAGTEAKIGRGDDVGRAGTE